MSKVEFAGLLQGAVGLLAISKKLPRATSPPQVLLLQLPRPTGEAGACPHRFSGLQENNTGQSQELG